MGQLSHAFLFDRILGTRPAFRPTIDISMDPPTSCQALLHHQQPHNPQTASGNDFVHVRKKFEHEATDPYSCGNQTLRNEGKGWLARLLDYRENAIFYSRHVTIHANFNSSVCMSAPKTADYLKRIRSAFREDSLFEIEAVGKSY